MGEVELVSAVERSVLVVGENGAVQFCSPHCRIADNGDGSFTITDLCAGPPSWIRSLAANEALGDL